MLLGEVSNPFLILRAILKIRGETQRTLYIVNEIVFICVFLVMRNWVSRVVTLNFFEYEQISMTLKLAPPLILMISSVWTLQIISMTLGKFVDDFGFKSLKPLNDIVFMTY